MDSIKAALMMKKDSTRRNLRQLALSCLPTRIIFGEPSMRRSCLAVTLVLVLILSRFSGPTQAGDKKDIKDSHLMVVPPAGGKEVKLVDWRFTLGTRRLDLDGAAPAKSKTKKPTGPEYLEFREDKSTTFQDGILTLVPMTSLRKLDYDNDKKTVTAVVVKAGDKEETLSGTTKFNRINKIVLEADAVLEGLGNAVVKFNGGTTDGLRSIRFPQPQAAGEAKGTVASIVAADKERTKHAALDLQPLYLVDGTYRLLPYVMFKKTVKIDMDKIASLRFIPSEDKKKISYDYEVTLRDGVKHTLTMLTKIDLEKAKSAVFEGFIGRVSVGYKLFPPHTIQELRVATGEKN
jgi:hypothetical protein